MRSRWLYLFFIVALPLLSSCRKAETPLPKQTLTINIGSDPTSVDPRKARDLNAIALCRMLFEGLTRISPQGTVELALAEKVDVSADGLRYTFHLRPSLWSNGEPVTSQDVAESWKRVLDPEFATDIAYQLYLIKHAKQVKGAQVPKDMLGLTTPDAQTLVVELEQPTPYFLEACAMSSYFFVPHTTSTEELNLTTLVGNGPFVLASWRHNDEIRVVKNQRYWEAPRVKLNEMALLMLNADTEMRLFEEEKLDWAGSPLSTIPVDAIQHLKRLNALKTSPLTGTYFLRVNVAHPKSPLRSAAFRQALAKSLDRAAIVEHILQAGQTPATSLVPPDMGLTVRVRNSLSAQELMDKALQELNLTREALEPLELNFSPSVAYTLPIVQAIQKQWEQALGIQVKLQMLEPKVHFQKVKQKDFQLAIGNWVADFYDPVNFLEVFKEKQASSNNTNWENSEYADLLTRSASIQDAQERKQHLSKAETILMQEMPVIPIFHFAMAYLQRPDLEGVIVSPIGQIDFRWAKIDESRAR